MQGIERISVTCMGREIDYINPPQINAEKPHNPHSILLATTHLMTKLTYI